MQMNVNNSEYPMSKQGLEFLKNISTRLSKWPIAILSDDSKRSRECTALCFFVGWSADASAFASSASGINVHKALATRAFGPCRAAQFHQLSPTFRATNFHHKVYLLNLQWCSNNGTDSAVSRGCCRSDRSSHPCRCTLRTLFRPRQCST